MNQDQLKQIEQTIRRQIQELSLEIERHREAARPVEPDNAIGRLTRMEAISARGISEASLNSCSARLARLQNTLKRLDSPDYGICSSCEEPIAIKRLLLMPESTRCVQCMNSD